MSLSAVRVTVAKAACGGMATMGWVCLFSSRTLIVPARPGHTGGGASGDGGRGGGDGGNGDGGGGEGGDKGGGGDGALKGSEATTGGATDATDTPRAVVSPVEPADVTFAAAAVADASLGMMTRASTVSVPASRRR